MYWKNGLRELTSENDVSMSRGGITEPCKEPAFTAMPEAIALRDDPTLLSQVAPHRADPKDKVRLVAAACVIRITDTATARAAHKK